MKPPFLINKKNLGNEGVKLRAECVSALFRILEHGVPAPVALQECYKKIGDERDRKLLKEIVMGVLRWKGSLENLLGFMSQSKSIEFLKKEILFAILCGMYQIFFDERVPDYAACNTIVEFVKNSAGQKTASYVNAILRKCTRAGNIENLFREIGVKDNDEIIWSSYPKWLRNKLEKQLGKGLAFEQAKAMNSPGDVFLRVSKNAPEDFTEILKREIPGIELENGRWLQFSRVIKKGGDVQSTSLFLKGLITIQDEGSQIAAVSCGVSGNSRVMDCCCGIGVKTGLIAEFITDGFVVAFDKSREKIKIFKKEMARIGAERVFVACADSTTIPLGSGAVFDRIIIDAPCSGTGSLSKKPDIKYRLKPSDPVRLSNLQYLLLESASNHLKENGVLIYSVCSILREEGIEVIERFLERNPQFSLIVPPGLPSPLVREASNGYLLLLPSIHRTEGFFIAAITRN